MIKKLFGNYFPKEWLFNEFKPKRKFRSFLLKQSFVKLLAASFVLYFLSILIFSFCYSCLAFPLMETKDNTPTNDCWDIVYFSIVTQSTVGYGDLIPNPSDKRSRIIASSQMVFSTFLISTLISILVFRLIRTESKIRFPKKLAYNKSDGTFLIKYINLDADALVNVEITAFLRKKLSDSEDNWIRHKMYRIKLTVDAESYVASMMPIACRTMKKDESEKPSIENPKKLATENPIFIDIDDFGVDDKFIIFVKGDSFTSGDSVSEKMIYRKTDVKDGLYVDSEKDLKEDFYDNPKVWKQIDYSKFDKID